MTSTHITTTISYVNARPHVGFALELVQADVLARYHRSIGEQVRLQAGTDDNSLKNVLAAQAAGVGVQEFVDANAAAFTGLAEPLSLSIDDLIRTSSDPRHRAGVERLWRTCAARGDLSRWWTGASRRVHLLGKGVLRFHAVYWPAMLLSAGEAVPTDIVVHGYLTENGRKIGKSSGATVDPYDLALDRRLVGLRPACLDDGSRVPLCQEQARHGAQRPAVDTRRFLLKWEDWREERRAGRRDER